MDEIGIVLIIVALVVWGLAKLVVAIKQVICGKPVQPKLTYTTYVPPKQREAYSQPYTPKKRRRSRRSYNASKPDPNDITFS